EVLPAPPDAEIITLGEGWTPLLHTPNLGQRVGLTDLLIKNADCNPTGSFKARGMSTAVTMAKYLGATRLAVPSAGNAGGALAAYAARAGVGARAFMPR